MATRYETTSKRAKGHEYLVVDPAGLADIVRDAIVRRYGGNRSRAANAVGIPHTTLKRYEEQRAPAVRHETLERLRRLVGPAQSALLDSALLTPGARAVLAEYDEWLQAETEVAEGGAKQTARDLLAVDEDGGPLSARMGLLQWDARTAETEQLLKELERRHSDLWAPLKRKLQQRGHFQPRAQLAFYRVIAPLLSGRDAGGIERDHLELSRNELRKFIRAGVQREVILLDRENDVRRAQSAGTDRRRQNFVATQLFRGSSATRARLGLRVYPPSTLNPSQARLLTAGPPAETPSQPRSRRRLWPPR